MKYKIAIFDLDGTILNTIEDLADSMNYALRRHKMPERSLEEVNSFVGNGIRKLVERAVVAESTTDTIDQVHATFTKYYKEHCKDKTKPYDGIKEMLKQLRDAGIITAVLSNKADYAVQILCQDFFEGLFDFALGDREGQRRKPYPDGVNTVLEQFHLTAKDSVYIGDSDVDIETAKNAAMDALIVSWGFRTEEFLKQHGAEIVVHTPEELIKYMS